MIYYATVTAGPVDKPAAHAPRTVTRTVIAVDETGACRAFGEYLREHHLRPLAGLRLVHAGE